MVKDIICFSSASWTDVWTNKQHIMSRLAARKHRVLYVTPAIDGSVLTFLKDRKKFGGWGISELDSTLKIADSFHLPLLSILRFLIPYNLFGFKVDLVKEYVSRCEKPVVWVYHPGYGHYLDQLPSECVVLYDCVDDFSTFPSTQDRLDWILEGEKKLLARADYVTVTAPALKESKSKLNSNVHYVHNVGDFKHFNRVQTESPSEDLPALAKISGKKIGFYGAISDYKLDFELLVFLAKSRPDWQFCLMGKVGEGQPGTNISELEQCENIHLLGLVDYDKLPSYLGAMDVLTIPYRVTDHTRHVFPIKFFECLATGKPLVCTGLDAIKDYAEFCRVGYDQDSFLMELEAAVLEDDLECVQRRVLCASRNDWDSRINKILKVIDQQ